MGNLVEVWPLFPVRWEVQKELKPRRDSAVTYNHYSQGEGARGEAERPVPKLSK